MAELMNVRAPLPGRLAAILLFSLAACALAADSTELAALRAEVRRLQDELATVSRRLEQLDAPKPASATAAAAPAMPVAPPAVSIEEKGIVLGSPENNFVRFRGLVQVDSRTFFGDGGGVSNNGFTLRRARLFTEGQFAKNFRYQLGDEFGGSTVSVLDANLTLSLSRELQFKFGKYKVPLGQELLQSESWTYFCERSLATNLVPNRDLGLQAMGELGQGVVTYQAGIFNGVADGANSTNSDFDNEKEAVGRFIAAPFVHQASSPLRGLAFGIAGSTGRSKTAAGRTSGFRTGGQQVFFAYSAATITDGRKWRIMPQLDYRLGRFGMISEYAVSTINVRAGAGVPKTELRNKAWKLAAGYVLTGEDSSPNGVTPRTRFDLAAGTWGAFEVVARYSRLDVDRAAFPLFAAPATNAENTKEAAVGFNWYLTRAFTFKFDYFRSQFGFNLAAPLVSANPILRQDEQAVVTRFQVTY